MRYMKQKHAVNFENNSSPEELVEYKKSREIMIKGTKV